ncbi:MAG: hypothetical protein KDM91_14635 [Verrucomicrobiae bacterium]|nr:hypothetical protein [Verrucomicrobiae bacterium]MCP5541963.1 hypothetical protein [Akkermansiaceae bacterium]
MTESNAPSAGFSGKLIALLPMFMAMALCWVAGEFYPLSSFPMYSKFDPRTYVAYLESPEGKPLPTVDTVNMFSSELKKIYGDGLAELKSKQKGSHFDWTPEQRREAGEYALRYLKETHSPKSFDGGGLKGLKLVDIRIFLKDGKITHEETEIATLP